MRVAWMGLLVVACTAPAKAPGHAEDVAHRRAVLERSLVNRDNAYARLRLAHYGEDWESLPEWNPPVADFDTSEPARALDLDAASLGRDAFVRYPVQIVPALANVRSPSEAAKYGLSHVVRVDRAFAVTCATCHTRAGDVGAPNEHLEYGRLLVDHGGGDATRLAWGPGRLDVTTMRGDEIVRIPDLRPVRFLTHLHHAGEVTNDIETLEVRLETLIITSNAATFRPPRAVTRALAGYLWSLGDTLPFHAPTTPEEHRGQSIFGKECARCHAPPAFSGPPVPAAAVGTDPTIARSPDRGTGGYRVPSLRGVSTRGALLHDGTVPSLDAFFDPARTQGHSYGRDLDEPSRHALLAYLRTL